MRDASRGALRAVGASLRQWPTHRDAGEGQRIPGLCRARKRNGRDHDRVPPSRNVASDQRLHRRSEGRTSDEHGAASPVGRSLRARFGQDVGVTIYAYRSWALLRKVSWNEVTRWGTTISHGSMPYGMPG